MHASFNQVVAATGRLSSSDPNLQNIPIRTEEGREIRSAFVPGPPGWKLLAADYSQIELRILAHYSEDAAMCAAFDRDDDIHTLVASQVFGVPLGDVTSAMRRSAKAVNFGVIYGQSPFGLAKGLGISQEEAAAFIDGYFETYRGVAEFMVRTLDECRRNGYRLDDPRPPPRDPRRAANRPAYAGHRAPQPPPAQPARADRRQHRDPRLRRRHDQAGHDRHRPPAARRNARAKMLLQIHDELVFEVAPPKSTGWPNSFATKCGPFAAPRAAQSRREIG